MKSVKLIPVGICVVLLTGCGTRTEDNKEPSAISDYQLESMEKARNVEQLLQDADEMRDNQ